MLNKKQIVINQNNGKNTTKSWGTGVEAKSTTIVNVFVMTSADQLSEAYDKIMEQVTNSDREINTFLLD